MLNSFNGQENVNTTICIFFQLKCISINLVNNPLQCLCTINFLITLIQLVVGGGGSFQLFLVALNLRKVVIEDHKHNIKLFPYKLIGRG